MTSSRWRLFSSLTIVTSSITAALLLSSFSFNDAKRLDCTRFVFAPRCRGVSAKRLFSLDNVRPSVEEQEQYLQQRRNQEQKKEPETIIVKSPHLNKDQSFPVHPFFTNRRAQDQSLTISSSLAARAKHTLADVLQSDKQNVITKSRSLSRGSATSLSDTLSDDIVSCSETRDAANSDSVKRDGATEADGRRDGEKCEE